MLGSQGKITQGVGGGGGGGERKKITVKTGNLPKTFDYDYSWCIVGVKTKPVSTLFLSFFFFFFFFVLHSMGNRNSLALRISLNKTTPATFKSSSKATLVYKISIKISICWVMFFFGFKNSYFKSSF